MIEPRFGVLPTDLTFCRACGRASRSIEGHRRVEFCYGCGAFRTCEQTREDSELGLLFGKGGWWPAQWGRQEIEFPGDVRFDPWSGDLIEADNPGGPTLEALQLVSLAEGVALC